MAVRVRGRVVVGLLLSAVGCAAVGVVVGVRWQAPAAVPSGTGGGAQPARAATAVATLSAAAARADGACDEPVSDDGRAGRTLGVEVVCAASGRAMAGAEVWLVDGRTHALAPAPSRWLAAFAAGPPEPSPGAPWVRAGADGSARLPCPAGTAWVVARWGRLEGASKVGADGARPDTVRVALAPSHRLTVVALDALGNAAAGVPIALRPAALGASDAANVATLPLGVTAPPIGALCVDLEPWAGSTDAVEVGIDVPGRAWLGVPVLPAAPPAHVVYLHAGATAALAVQVVQADGTPAPAGVAVQLGTSDPARGVMAFLRTCFVATTDARGATTFPVVGREARLWVRVAAPGLVAVHAIDAAPAGASERRVTCVLPEPRVVVRGRALDGRGAPLCGATVQLTWQSGDARRPRGAIATTDDRGAFAFALAAVDGGVLRSARIARVVAGRLSDEGCVLGDVSLPERGDVPLGALQLGIAPVLAAGRVVGDAVAGEVVLWVEGVDSGEALVPDAWVERSGADGFVVRGEAAATGLRLCAACAGSPCAAPLPFAAGDRGLVLCLGGADAGAASPPGERSQPAAADAPSVVPVGGALRVSTRAARVRAVPGR